MSQEENKSKKGVKILVGIALVPVTTVVFYYLPSIIADKVSYYQSQKYRKGN